MRSGQVIYILHSETTGGNRQLILLTQVFFGWCFERPVFPHTWVLEK